MRNQPSEKKRGGGGWGNALFGTHPKRMEGNIGYGFLPMTGNNKNRKNGRGGGGLRQSLTGTLAGAGLEKAVKKSHQEVKSFTKRGLFPGIYETGGKKTKIGPPGDEKKYKIKKQARLGEHSRE